MRYSMRIRKNTQKNNFKFIKMLKGLPCGKAFFNALTLIDTINCRNLLI